MKRNNTNKKSNINKKRIGLFAILGIIAIGGTVLYNVNLNNFTNKSPLVNNISGNGIKIKMLDSKTENGNIVNKYSYTITPDNATNPNLKAVASYVDGSEYDNIVMVNIDTSSKIITLTTSATKGFDKQIKITITSESNPDISAQMLVDFKQKALSVNAKNISLNVGANQDNNVLAEHLLEATFTKYTIEDNFEYSFSSFDVSNAKCYLEYSNVSILPSNQSMLDGLANLFASKIFENKRIPTQNEIWNLYSSNDWHSFLKKCENETNFFAIDGGKFIPTIKSGSGEIVKGLESSLSLSVYLNYDWTNSEFFINVDSITIEETNVIF